MAQNQTISNPSNHIVSAWHHSSCSKVSPKNRLTQFPPAYLEVKGIWRSRIGAITIRIFTTSQAQCWLVAATSVGFQCAVSCHYIQGTIEVGRFARVIEDGIPLWGPKSEEPAFPSCLDPCFLEFGCIAACRSLRNLSSSEQIQTSNLLYINVHQCTSYSNLFMFFFHCAHNSQFPRRCCSSPILGEIASAKLRPDTEFTATFRWCRTGMGPHLFNQISMCLWC